MCPGCTLKSFVSLAFLDGFAAQPPGADLRAPPLRPRGAGTEATCLPAQLGDGRSPAGARLDLQTRYSGTFRLYGKSRQL